MLRSLALMALLVHCFTDAASTNYWADKGNKLLSFTFSIKLPDVGKMQASIYGGANEMSWNWFLASDFNDEGDIFQLYAQLNADSSTKKWKLMNMSSKTQNSGTEGPEFSANELLSCVMTIYDNRPATITCNSDGQTSYFHESQYWSADTIINLSFGTAFFGNSMAQWTFPLSFLGLKLAAAKEFDCTAVFSGTNIVSTISGQGTVTASAPKVPKATICEWDWLTVHPPS